MTFVIHQTRCSQNKQKLVNDMIECCKDKNCEFYGRKLVDLGWGQPVCRSVPAKLYPIPLDHKYKGYKKYYKVIHCKVME